MVLALLFILAAVFGSVATAAALETLPLDGSTKYFYVSNPSALYATGDGVYLADEGAVYHFSESGAYLDRQTLAGVTAITGGDGTLYALKDNKIYSSTGNSLNFSQILDPALDVLLAPINDIAYADGKLHIATGTFVYTYTAGALSFENADDDVLGLTSYQSEVYYYTRYGSRYAYYQLGDKTNSKENIETKISQIAASSITKGGRRLIYFLMGNICYFEIDENGNFVKNDGKDVIWDFTAQGESIRNAERISVFNDYVYYVTSLGALYRVSEVTHTREVLFASDSDEPGFFSSVSAVAAHGGYVYAADRISNRIAVYGDTRESYITVEKPAALSVNDEGALYVASNGNRIVKYGADKQKTDEAYTLGISVTALFSGREDTLFALADKKLYIFPDGLTVKGGGTAPAVLQLAENVDAFIFDRYSGLVYLSRGGKVLSLDPEQTPLTETECFDYPDPIRDFAVDGGGNFYLLINRVDGSDIVRIEKGDTAADAEVFTLDDVSGDAAAVSISSTNNPFIDPGELLIADNGRRRVVKASADGLKVKVLTRDDANLDGEDDFIIRRVVKSGKVFTAPDESESFTTLQADMLVIVPKYDTDILPFSYVLYSDAASETLRGGFFLRAHLSDPLPYALPELSVTAFAYSDNTPLFRYPSVYAAKVVESMDKDTKLSLLEFADFEADGHTWFKARTENGITGYVTVNAVWLRNFLPDNTPVPQANATVISKHGSTGAFVYRYYNRNYERIDDSPMLPNGTRVEIRGGYDNTKKYTLIRYYDDSVKKTAECYVETVYLDYDGISAMQVVAFVIMALCMVLLVIVVIRYSMYKKLNGVSLMH